MIIFPERGVRIDGQVARKSQPVRDMEEGPEKERLKVIDRCFSAGD